MRGFLKTLKGRGFGAMSASSQNYVYQVVRRKKTDKPEPTLTKERLDRVLATVGKYQSVAWDEDELETNNKK